MAGISLTTGLVWGWPSLHGSAEKVARRQNEPSWCTPSGLWTFQEGHLQFSRLNRAVTRYRIHESLLSVEHPFPYTSAQAKAIVVKGRDDPWPLPEPLKARQR